MEELDQRQTPVWGLRHADGGGYAGRPGWRRPHRLQTFSAKETTGRHGSLRHLNDNNKIHAWAYKVCSGYHSDLQKNIELKQWDRPEEMRQRLIRRAKN